MIRTAPQGLEVFRPMVNPEDPNKAVMTIDYYSVEVDDPPNKLLAIEKILNPFSP